MPIDHLLIGSAISADRHRRDEYRNYAGTERSWSGEMDAFKRLRVRERRIAYLKLRLALPTRDLGDTA